MASRTSDVPIRMTAEVERIGARRIVRVPTELSASLPSRGQVAVAGTIGGVDVVTVVEPDGAKGHWLDVAAGTVDDDAAEVAIDVRTLASDAWPEPTVPDDLRAALDASATASAAFAAVTPMARWEWVRWIRATRNDATRAKRVGVAVSKLDAGSRRPCCFDLSSCTDPELARSGRLVADER